jgi:signal transduction histidine kinase
MGESPGDLSLENRLVAADGSLNYVEWNISRPLQGKYLAIGRNVTLKRKHEEEITRNARSLERSLRELDQFAYVVSHDLKSPLRGIYSLADFIAEDLAEGNGPAVHEHLELLKRRVDRMQNLILGVLEYTRAGKDLEVRSPIVMATFLGQVGQGMKLPANFELNFPDQLPVVIFNPQKLRQILQNLISNAVRFNDKPQGRVDIDCIETPDSWEISVTDNGPGIEERFHEQVFSMFRTLQSRDDLEATGMGLPIVKKIVTEAGGSIHIDRGYAGGTRIVFSIVRN